MRGCHKHIRGVTLIELAIVLIVIALIIGGIVLGDSMIGAAQIRAGISEIEKYDAAVVNFKAKYGGLPGDLRSSDASLYGLTSRAGGTGHGDDNQLLQPPWPAAWVGFCGETRLFFPDLTNSGLLEGGYLGTDTSYYDCQGGAALDIEDVGDYVPTWPLGEGNFIFVWSDGTSKNFYQVFGGFSSIDDTWACLMGNSLDVFTPMEAKAIDDKMDDGLPLTGSVRARTWTSGTLYALRANYIPTNDTAAAPALGVCVSNESGNPYNTTVKANAPACAISFEMVAP